MSPELLDPEGFGLNKCRPTKESDIYALGIVVYEVLSGQIPYSQLRTPIVMWKVLEGMRPERPQGELFTDVIWSVLERCWKPQPSDRPGGTVVLQCLGGAPSLSRQASGMDMVSDDHSDTTTSDAGTFSVASKFPDLPGLPDPGSTDIGYFGE